MTRLAFCVVSWRDGDGNARRHAANVARAAIATGMPKVATGPNYTILSNRTLSFFPDRDGGQIIVIGTACGTFLTSSARNSISISSRIADPKAAAHRLCDAIWGSYIAVIPTVDGPMLFMDPSGGLPFDLVETDDVTVATDDFTPTLCRTLGYRPKIEWASLIATLVSPATAVHLPHLVGVEPAAPGRLYKMGTVDGGTTIWSPTDIARRVSDDGVALRAAIDRSTAAMGGAASALQLSGGLDSSIVLSSLCAAHHPRCRSLSRRPPVAATSATMRASWRGIAGRRW